MDPVGLDSLLPELLIYLCLFLSEVDIISVSQTCKHLREVLNDDAVWKRFVTEEIKSLKTLKQQLEPPFHPDPNLCENRQHLQRRDLLISNWRNGNYINKSRGIEPRLLDDKLLFSVEFFQENYLLATFYEDHNRLHHVFWNITGCPKVQAERTFHTFLYLIRDTFVCKTCCEVEVYRNITNEDMSFSLLYSFSIEGETVNYQPGRKPEHNGCQKWVESIVGNYLVFSKESSDLANPVIHIWDIVNAEKVGAFVSPVMCRYLEVYGLVEESIILKAQGVEEIVCLKVGIRSKRFSDTFFKIELSPLARDEPTSVTFYKDYCIVMRDSSRSDPSTPKVTLETYEFNTSKKISETCFIETSYELQLKECNDFLAKRRESTVIVDGKLFVVSEGKLLVVDAVSLEILIVTSSLGVLKIIGVTSVFDTSFLVTAGNNGTIRIWDVEKNRSYSTTHFTLNRKSLEGVRHASREFCIFPKIGPKTKCAIVGDTKLNISHFW